VDVPAGLVLGADMRIIKESVYFKAGIDYVYMISGGKGSTLDPSGTEVVDVTYKQWSVDVPFTFGVALLFWDEARVYLGIGIAMAYGTYSNSFKSASLDHSASFTGYALPLVAEAGCEYLFTERISAGCGMKYLYGRSKVINDGDDYARVDFTGFQITASAGLHFNL
jgi:opacity protein-like surface antigen